MEKDINVSASAAKKSTLKPHPTKDEIVLLAASDDRLKPARNGQSTMVRLTH
jgi:hypothetical protein